MRTFLIAILLVVPFQAVAATDGVLSQPTCFIDAQPRIIVEGAPVRLSWRTEHAADVSISNIGSVSPEDFSIRYPSYGRADYVLTAKGAGGVAICSVTVIVTHSIVAEIGAQGWFTAWFVAPVVYTWRYVSEPITEWFVVEEEYITDDLVPARGIFGGNLIYEEEITFERDKERSGFGERETSEESTWWERIYDRAADRLEEIEEYYSRTPAPNGDINEEEELDETKERQNRVEEIYEEDEKGGAPTEASGNTPYGEETSEGDIKDNISDLYEEEEYVPPEKNEPVHIDEVEIYE